MQPRRGDQTVATGGAGPAHEGRRNPWFAGRVTIRLSLSVHPPRQGRRERSRLKIAPTTNTSSAPPGRFPLSIDYHGFRRPSRPGPTPPVATTLRPSGATIHSRVTTSSKFIITLAVVA